MKKNDVWIKAVLLALVFTLKPAVAAPLYWDLNGAVAGSGGGTSPSGTWDSGSSNWSTDPAGGAATQAWGAGPASAWFSAGTNATGSYTITVNGPQSVNDILVKDGTVTFNPGSGAEFDFTGNNSYYSNYVAAGHTAIYNVPFGGFAPPDKWGPGVAVYNVVSTATNYYFTLNEGTIAIGNDLAFGTLPIYLGDVAGLNTVTLRSADASPHTITNEVDFIGSHFVMDTGLGSKGGDLTFTSPIDFGSTLFPPAIITVSNITTLSGRLFASGGAGIVKDGSGTLIFSGSDANTYGMTGNNNGSTTVAGGILKLAKTNGASAIHNGTLVVTGGTVLLGGSNQINTANVPLTLGGGTFNTGGFNESVGALRLTANSGIDLGNGGIFKIASSASTPWTAGTTLAVTDWSGLAAGGGTNQLVFGSSSSALTAGQVGQIDFVNPTGFAAGIYTSQMLGTGEVVPGTAISPTLIHTVIGTNLVLSWSGPFILQSSTNVVGPYLVVPGATSPYTNSLASVPQLFFRLAPPVAARPSLGSARDGNNLVLSWSGSYTLQSSTNVTGSYADVPGATSPFSTNMLAIPQQYFRLRQ